MPQTYPYISNFLLVWIIFILKVSKSFQKFPKVYKKTFCIAEDPTPGSGNIFGHG